MRIRKSVLVAGLGVAITAFATVAMATGAGAAANPVGPDVSSHQGNVNWSSVKSNGASFETRTSPSSTTARTTSG
jgi:lysozyme